MFDTKIFLMRVNESSPAVAEIFNVNSNKMIVPEDNNVNTLY